MVFHFPATPSFQGVFPGLSSQQLWPAGVQLLVPNFQSPRLFLFESGPEDIRRTQTEDKISKYVLFSVPALDL